MKKTTIETPKAQDQWESTKGKNIENLKNTYFFYSEIYTAKLHQFFISFFHLFLCFFYSHFCSLFNLSTSSLSFHNISFWCFFYIFSKLTALDLKSWENREIKKRRTSSSKEHAEEKITKKGMLRDPDVSGSMTKSPWKIVSQVKLI